MREPELIYMDHRDLQRISDQQALNQYLIDLAQERYEAPVENHIKHRLIRIVRSEVRKLSKEEQGLIHLRFWQDQTLKEMAQTLAVSVQDVKEKLQEILKTLRTEITKGIQYHYRFDLEEILCLIDR